MRQLTQEVLALGSHDLQRDEERLYREVAVATGALVGGGQQVLDELVGVGLYD
jgi:hypothetical protein